MFVSFCIVFTVYSLIDQSGLFGLEKGITGAQYRFSLIMSIYEGFLFYKKEKKFSWYQLWHYDLKK